MVWLVGCEGVASGIEGIADRNVDVLVGLVLRTLMTDDDVRARHAHDDVHGERAARVVMGGWCRHSYIARADRWVLSHLDLQQKFMPTPSVTRADLESSVRACLDSHDSCSGIEIKPQSIQRQRIGNVVLDVFDFQRETLETGWVFVALVLIQDNKVVYKTWSGSPNLRSVEKETNPLGPLQELGGFAGDRAQAAF